MNANAALRARQVRERIDEPLFRHTTWRVGGPADRFYTPERVDDLIDWLGRLPRATPLLWLGNGSNLLVRDGGFRGAVVALAGAPGVFRAVQGVGDNLLRAEAGVACARLAREARRAHLGGLEFLAGIPGTVGGALAMNAGAFGDETWRWVERVETVDRDGRLRTRAPADYAVGYRSVALNGAEGAADEWFIAATFRLRAGAAEAGAVRSLLARRNATQPLGWPNCGSVFRNPPGDYAARLIEASGLKGLRRGGAAVSTLHANFIVNEGEATAADIEALIDDVRAAVEQKQGVRLELEVRIVGEAATEKRKGVAGM